MIAIAAVVVAIEGADMSAVVVVMFVAVVYVNAVEIYVGVAAAVDLAVLRSGVGVVGVGEEAEEERQAGLAVVVVVVDFFAEEAFLLTQADGSNVVYTFPARIFLEINFALFLFSGRKLGH